MRNWESVFKLTRERDAAIARAEKAGRERDVAIENSNGWRAKALENNRAAECNAILTADNARLRKALEAIVRLVEEACNKHCGDINAIGSILDCIDGNARIALSPASLREPDALSPASLWGPLK